MYPAHNYHPQPGRHPLHAGIIPDGGRRWAVDHECSLANSYAQTKKVLLTFVNLLLDKGFREISIYISSIQNHDRTDDEISSFLDSAAFSMGSELTELAIRRQLRIVIAGVREILPDKILRAIRKTEENTLNHKEGRLNLLLAYDPLEEVRNAFYATPAGRNFTDYLTITTPVDLVIRTGKAALLSNFLPLQSGFARLAFIDKLFNDMTVDELDEILHDFSTFDRKYGT